MLLQEGAVLRRSLRVPELTACNQGLTCHQWGESPGVLLGWAPVQKPSRGAEHAFIPVLPYLTCQRGEPVRSMCSVCPSTASFLAPPGARPLFRARDAESATHRSPGQAKEDVALPSPSQYSSSWQRVSSTSGAPTQYHTQPSDARGPLSAGPPGAEMRPGPGLGLHLPRSGHTPAKGSSAQAWTPLGGPSGQGPRGQASEMGQWLSLGSTASSQAAGAPGAVSGGGGVPVAYQRWSGGTPGALPATPAPHTPTPLTPLGAPGVGRGRSGEPPFQAVTAGACTSSNGRGRGRGRGRAATAAGAPWEQRSEDTRAGAGTTPCNRTPGSQRCTHQPHCVPAPTPPRRHPPPAKHRSRGVSPSEPPVAPHCLPWQPAGSSRQRLRLLGLCRSSPLCSRSKGQPQERLCLHRPLLWSWAPLQGTPRGLPRDPRASASSAFEFSGLPCTGHSHWAWACRAAPCLPWLAAAGPTSGAPGDPRGAAPPGPSSGTQGCSAGVSVGEGAAACAWRGVLVPGTGCGCRAWCTKGGRCSSQRPG